MTELHNDFASVPVRTSAWGGGEACGPGSARAKGGWFICPIYDYGKGNASGEGNCTRGGGYPTPAYGNGGGQK